MTYPHDLQRRTEPGALELARDEVLERLGIHYAHGDLTIKELEARLELAFRSRSTASLEELVADLPSLHRGRSRDETSYGVTEMPLVPARGMLAAIMGGNVRKGSWALPRHLKIVAIMGGVELDLRQAVLSPGVTEIEVLTVMGGVDIAVPPGVRVETMGIAIMGGFDASAGDVTTLDPDQPVIRLSGIAVMGGVDARIKAPNAKAIRRFNRALLKARARADRSE